MPAPLPRLIIASSNPGKLRELEQLLGAFATEIVSQSALGIEGAQETATTFEGNALLKARHAARLGQGAALADDSGLEVDALGGRPGVYSARYAGKSATDTDNNARLVEELRQVPEPRRARYRCVIAFIQSADDPDPVLAEGSWEGSIVLEPRGSGGFGYDPYFVPAGGELTAAELPLETKNRVSHRALALNTLLERLRRA